MRQHYEDVVPPLQDHMKEEPKRKGDDIRKIKRLTEEDIIEGGLYRLLEEEGKTLESIQIGSELEETEGEIHFHEEIADKKREHIDMLDFLMAKLNERIEERGKEK